MKKSILLCNGATYLSAVAIALVYQPAYGQETESADEDAIVVTARRVEERLQDVPISITVFNQDQLNANNIANAKDLADYTPGLAVSTRYGADATTFTIRGFSQELRTTATVATYFADVVAPRGGGINTGGDGAGPGQLFDLENVQVLKGPQGTLFGRNTTGGAVLLVPKKPVDRFEGYLEATVGGFNQRRIQGVVNLPISDNVRARLGFDRNKRDGYLNNIGLGRKDLGDVDYWTVRASLLADITPDVENYTVFTYVNSDNSGVLPKVGLCAPTVTLSRFGFSNTGQLLCDQMDREAATGNKWTVSNPIDDSRSLIKQWQVLNTTTWHASDNLTVKNILAYGELRTSLQLDLYGTYIPLGGLTADQVTRREQVLTFVSTYPDTSSGYSNSQSQLVEELRLEGTNFDGRLVWQAGFYYEENKPLGWSGVSNGTYTPCSYLGPPAPICLPSQTNISSGSGSWSRYQNSFRSIAGYAQASYDLTERLKGTIGFRYTDDKTDSKQASGSYFWPANAAPYATCRLPTMPGFGQNLSFEERFIRCEDPTVSKKSSAPTWLIGLDYRPADSVLLYAKYSRGYRMGSVMAAAPDGLMVYEPEKVDTYELGMKASWRGAVPGTFNLAGYYNDFTDQQLQLGLGALQPGLSSTTAIVNAGSSRMYGIDAELSLKPFVGFSVDVAYSYLNTKLTSVDPVIDRPEYFEVPPLAGGELPFAMKHKLTASARYTLPLSEDIGRISIGGTLIHQSGYRVGGGENQVIPSYTWGNVNVSWEDIGGVPFDAVLFITNVTNEFMYTNANDQLAGGGSRLGFVSYNLAEPRIWGLRLKYRFGN